MRDRGSATVADRMIFGREAKPGSCLGELAKALVL